MDNGLLLELCYISPLLILLSSAVVLLLLDLIFKSGLRFPAALAAIACLVALLAAGALELFLPARATVFNLSLFVDSFSRFFWYLIIGASLLTLLLMVRSLKQECLEKTADLSVLVLLATAGAISLVSAGDLLIIFLSLELLSLSSCALASSVVGQQRPAEAGLKYFLLGALGSIFILFGLALLYGIAGSTGLGAIASQVATADQGLLGLSLGFVLAGLLFKLGLVPFHYWVPDVYQGAPVTFTVFFSSTVKIAAVGLSLRFLYLVFGNLSHLWQGVVWISAVLSVSIPTLTALRQTSLKRILAFSAVAQAGYLSIGFLGLGNHAAGLQAVLYYLSAYLLAGIGAWTVLSVLTARRGYDSERLDRFDTLQGLGRTHPCLAALFTIFLLSLAGLPPGLAGLLAKILVLNVAVTAGYISLAIIGAVFAVIACNYYLRIIVVMYFHEVNSANSGQLKPGLLSMGLMWICLAGLFWIGIFPARFLQYLNTLVPSL